MNTDALTVTIEARLRPWWRPLGLRSFRRWYREARRDRGRLMAAACAFIVARRKFFIVSDRKATAL